MANTEELKRVEKEIVEKFCIKIGCDFLDLNLKEVITRISEKASNEHKK